MLVVLAVVGLFVGFLGFCAVGGWCFKGLFDE